MYHTQESRTAKLTAAVPCVRDDAWLGEGLYFWNTLHDADYWGNTSKKATGYYEVYQSLIESENLLDTVFNEEHYEFWLKQIEKVGMKFVKDTGNKPTLKELNDYFKEKATWTEVDGILFQDLPANNNFLMVKPIIKPVPFRGGNREILVSFAYRKRIQLVVYNSKIITNFDLLKREQVLKIK
jgi:hypothetical protein